MSMRRGPFVCVRKTWPGFARAESGASAAEFALCLPLLVVMLMGMFEFGWTQHCLSSVRFGLEKAGRYLSVHPQATEAELADIVAGHMDALADGLVGVALVREARGPTGETGVITASYRRDVGIPGLVTIPIDYEAAIETPISQFAGS